MMKPYKCKCPRCNKNIHFKEDEIRPSVGDGYEGVRCPGCDFQIKVVRIKDNVAYNYRSVWYPSKKKWRSLFK